MARTHAFIALLFLGFFTVRTQGQQILSGRVADEEGSPLAYASVLLLTASDSSMVRGAVTNETGNFKFEDIETGTYRVSVSRVGYETVITEMLTVSRIEARKLPTIVLQEGQALEEIIVSSTKPLYELQQDRIVMNVGAYPAMSGNTGLELLQKSPGVIVNWQNNSISLGAKGEVLLMINDQIQRVPAAVLFAQLQGMRAENIERIELIHQPPARYDASGAAGIVHIVTKKNRDGGHQWDAFPDCRLRTAGKGRSQP